MKIEEDEDIPIDDLVDVDTRLDYLISKDEIKHLKEANNEAYSTHNPAKSQHHTDWDRHILTISTATLGFIYGILLPNFENSDPTLVWYASASFGLAIIITMLNFILADQTFEASSKMIRHRDTLITALTECLNEKEMIELMMSSPHKEQIDIEKVNIKKEELYIRADDARGEYNDRVKYESNTIDVYSKGVNILNITKTILFLIGILITIGYVFENT